MKIQVKNKETVLKEIEDKLGVVLMAKKSDDTVNGYINFSIENGKEVVDIILYEKDEAPTFKKYKKDGVSRADGRKSTLKKVDSALQQMEIAKRKA